MKMQIPILSPLVIPPTQAGNRPRVWALMHNLQWLRDEVASLHPRTSARADGLLPKLS